MRYHRDPHAAETGQSNARKHSVRPMDRPVYMRPLVERQRFQTERAPVQRGEEETMTSRGLGDRYRLQRFHSDSAGEKEAGEGQRAEEGEVPISQGHPSVDSDQRAEELPDVQALQASHAGTRCVEHSDDVLRARDVHRQARQPRKVGPEYGEVGLEDRALGQTRDGLYRESEGVRRRPCEQRWQAVNTVHVDPMS